MRKRYWVLRFAVFLMKASAIVWAGLGTGAWIIGHGRATYLIGTIPPGQIQDAFTSTALFFTILEIVAIWLIAVFQWATAEFVDAIIDTAESSRAASILLVRLVRHEVPGELPDYMKSIHGVWDDAPPARTPDEHWKRAPGEESGTLNLDNKHRVYRRLSGEPPSAPRYRDVPRPRKD